MPELRIDAERLLRRLQTLGGVGRDSEGRLTRLAASNADRAGRDVRLAVVDRDLVRDQGVLRPYAQAPWATRLQTAPEAPVMPDLWDALVACYLIEARKTLLDHIVEMNDQFLTGMNRRAENTVKARERVLRRRARAGMDRVLDGIDALAAADGDQTVQAFRKDVDTPGLVAAAAACRALNRLEERGHLDAMLARYGRLRQFLPAFVTLPFQAAVGSESLLAAIGILRELDAGARDGQTR